MAYRIPKFSIKMVREGHPVRVAHASDAAAVARIVCCADPTVETMAVLVLDSHCNVRGAIVVATGGANRLTIGVREILRPVLIAGAFGFILAHNHPSGDPTPSAEDHAVTRAVVAASDVVGVHLLDHLIVTETRARFSFAESTSIISSGASDARSG